MDLPIDLRMDLLEDLPKAMLMDLLEDLPKALPMDLPGDLLMDLLEDLSRSRSKFIKPKIHKHIFIGRCPRRFVGIFTRGSIRKS